MQESFSSEVSNYIRYLAQLSTLLRDYDQTLQQIEASIYYRDKFEILGRFKDKAEAEKATNQLSKEAQVIEEYLMDKLNLTIEQARTIMSDFVGALKVHEDAVQELARVEHGYYILDKAGLLVDSDLELEEDEASQEPLNYLRSRMDRELQISKARVEGSLERLHDLSTRKILVVSA